MSSHEPPIIIKKVVKGGHGHHGGSWKVAYADFVTAMMALFIVLWVIGQDKPVKQAIAMYFSDPSLTSEEISIKLAQNAKEELETPIPAKVEKDTAKDDPKKDKLKLLAKKVKGALESVAWKQKLEGQIIIEMTEEGLRIELLDFAKSPFFHVGSAKPTPRTRTALIAIAKQIKSVDNPIVLEGHTDGRPFSSSAVKGYGNWELSTDRANAARRLLEEGGIPQKRIQAVRGYADTKLRHKANPFDDRNRRISILIKLDETEEDVKATRSSVDSPKKDSHLGEHSGSKTAHPTLSAHASGHH